MIIEIGKDVKKGVKIDDNCSQQIAQNAKEDHV